MEVTLAFSLTLYEVFEKDHFQSQATVLSVSLVQTYAAEWLADCKCLLLLFNQFDIEEVRRVTEERSRVG